VDSESYQSGIASVTGLLCTSLAYTSVYFEGSILFNRHLFELKYFSNASF
jgi:hypothetical protein